MHAISQMEPMVPTLRGDLEDLALEVFKASATIAGRVHPLTAARVIVLLRSVNSYYSNLIEGIRTTLLDIESGLAKLSEDERTRRLQQLHRQNVAAQDVVEKECERIGPGITAPGFLRHLHGLLFDGVAQEFLMQRNLSGTRQVVTIPGRLREENVRVGAHVPLTGKIFRSFSKDSGKPMPLNQRKGLPG